VIDATGNRVACIEYQRSKESFEAFKARDELRCSEFGEVLWFFRAGAYGSSLDHRDYLADRSRRFFKAFTDPETGQLQCQEGERPVRRASLGRDHTLEACSESSLLRAIDPPDRASNGDRLYINTSLDLGVVTKQAAPPNPRSSRKTHRPILTVTDRVRAAIQGLDGEYHESIEGWHPSGDGWNPISKRWTGLEIIEYDSRANQFPLTRGEVAKALSRIRHEL